MEPSGALGIAPGAGPCFYGGLFGPQLIINGRCGPDTEQASGGEGDNLSFICVHSMINAWHRSPCEGRKTQPKEQITNYEQFILRNSWKGKGPVGLVCSCVCSAHTDLLEEVAGELSNS